VSASTGPIADEQAPVAAPRHPLSVRTYFALLLVLFALVATASAAYVYQRTAQDARAQAVADAHFAAQTAAAQVAQTLKIVQGTAAGLAANPSIGNVIDHPAGCTLSFSGGGGAGDRSHLDLLRTDGTVVCSSRAAAKGSLGSYAGASWLARARTHAVQLAPVLDPATGAHMAVSAVPVPGHGTVVALYDLDTAATHLVEIYGGGHPTEFLVTTKDRRTVVMRSVHPERWDGRALAGTDFSQASKQVDRRDLDGTTRIYQEATVAFGGWHFYVGEDKHAVLEPGRQLARRESEIILVGFAALALFTLFAYRRLAWPLRRLAGAVRDSAGSSPRSAVPVAGPVEVSALAGDVNELIGSVNRELEARKRNEAQLRLLAGIVESSDDAILAADLTGTVTAWNGGAEELYGYTAAEAIGQPASFLVPEERADEPHELLARVGAGEPVSQFETERVHKDGTAVPVLLTVSPVRDEHAQIVGISAIAHDISKRKQAEEALRRSEEHLRQSQKMEAIGNLAGGIAHDFNNILMVIRMCAAMRLDEASGDAEREDLERIDSAAERAAELTHRLLAFSRQQVLEPEITDLNAAAEEAHGLLQRLIPETIEVYRELEPDIEPILVDRSELTQVILNLAVNARDAMPDGGTLALRTTNVFLDADYASEHLDVKPGAYTMLQITDTGVGMDAETQARAFDPFFTTKADGTGFGLATVEGIVKQSGGHIWLYSEPGLGTTFKLYFPVATTGSRIESARPTATLTGGETILLVEDEEQVRRLVGSALRSFGYAVLEAAHAEEALELAEATAHIDLLLTDIVMPGLNGHELAQRLVASRPGLRVLFTSGYPADAALREGIAAARAAYLEKPYLPDELARKIRFVLDGQGLDDTLGAPTSLSSD
jgi:PAS domain S-box-containing protein